jgi:hypothetical protein
MVFLWYFYCQIGGNWRSEKPCTKNARVSVAICGGYKVITRQEKTVQEVFVLTILAQEQFKYAIAIAMKIALIRKSNQGGIKNTPPLKFTYSSTSCTENLCNGKLRIQEKVRKYDKALVIFRVVLKPSQSGKIIFSIPKATQ